MTAAFKPFALALVDFGHGIGEAWMETDPSTSVESVADMIWNGDREGVQQVIFIEGIGKPVTDVTAQIADMLAERITAQWATDAVEHHEDLYNFVESFSKGWKRPRGTGRAA
jgi:hypothetical protein